MSFLLRRTRRAVWIGAGRDREAAIREFERRDEDTDGLSVFEVEDEGERLTIVAAIACERENCDRVDLIEMERAFVEQYGQVKPTPEKGTTPVPEANQKHCRSTGIRRRFGEWRKPFSTQRRSLASLRKRRCVLPCNRLMRPLSSGNSLAPSCARNRRNRGKHKSSPTTAEGNALAR